jgi:kynurenine formamidase
MLAAACGQPIAPPAFPAGDIVDLSHAFDAQTIYWPTAERFRLDVVSEGVTSAGYYYAANNLFTAEHGGTHLDAPIHFAAGGSTAAEIPLRRLIGPAVVVGVEEQCERDVDYRITTDDLLEWEVAHGRIPSGAIVLLRTGFSRHWPDPGRYLGTTERGEAAVAQLHFPGLHPDAAEWLVANRSIGAIGIDTASIDFGQSSQYESHRTLFAHEVPALENLAALDRLPPTGAFVVALPMKIARGSGGPLRAVAILPAS